MQFQSTATNDSAADSSASTSRRTPLTALQLEGLRRVIKHMHTINSKCNVGAQAAAYFILCWHEGAHGRFFCSHGTVQLPLSSGLQWVDSYGDGLQGSILRRPNDSTGKTSFFVHNLLHDYIFRPDALDHLCWYDFTLNYYKVAKASDKLRFQPAHPAHKPAFGRQMTAASGFTAGVQRRAGRTPVMNQIWGRIPDLKTLGNTDDPTVFAQMERYGKQMLLLFHPFRTREDLIQAGAIDSDDPDDPDPSAPGSDSPRDCDRNTWWARLHRCEPAANDGSVADDRRLSLSSVRTRQMMQRQHDKYRNEVPTEFRLPPSRDDADAPHRRGDYNSGEVVINDAADIDMLMQDFVADDDSSATPSIKPRTPAQDVLLRLRGHTPSTLTGLLLPTTFGRNLQRQKHSDGTWVCVQLWERALKAATALRRPVTPAATSTSAATSLPEPPVHHDDDPSRPAYSPSVQAAILATVLNERLECGDLDPSKLPSVEQAATNAGLDQTQTAAFKLVAAAYIQGVLDDRTVMQTADALRPRLARAKSKINSILGASTARPSIARKSTRRRPTPVHRHAAQATTPADGAEPPTPQLLMYLMGPGGTGKTRVVNTLRTFVQTWDSVVYPSDTPRIPVRYCAFTGCAAVLIGGRTLNSTFGIGNACKFFNRSDAMGNELSDLRLLFIDEISMVSPKLLLRVHQALAHHKHKPHLPFGGVHVCLAGDFHQLRPVMAVTLLNPIQPSKNNGVLELFNCVMRHFNTAIVLHRNYRFAGDEAWQRVNNNVHAGTVTRSDIDLINSRTVYSDAGVTPEQARNQGTVAALSHREQRFVLRELHVNTGETNASTASSDEADASAAVTYAANATTGAEPPLVLAAWNSMCDAVNRDVAQAAATSFGEQCAARMIIAEATPTTGRSHKPVTRDTTDRLHASLGLKEMGFINLRLPLFTGATVTVTQNTAVPLGVAKGTTGVIKSIALTEAGQELVRTAMATNPTEPTRVPVKEIIGVFIQDTQNRDKVYMDGWAPGLFIAYPIRQKAKVKIPPNAGIVMNNASMTFTALQLPLAVAACITVYKVRRLLSSWSLRCTQY